MERKTAHQDRDAELGVQKKERKKAEEAPNKATENVDTEAAKAISTLSENDEFENLQKEQEVQVLSDELCPDDIYHQAESEVLNRKLLDVLSVECGSCQHLT